MLGTVWRLGPCSAYQVRKRFQESPSSHWSGSAGAIYPLMRRLDAAGLLRSRPTEDGRRTRHYELTAAGQRALRKWLLPPVPDQDIAHEYNPIRLRLFFIDALEAEEQRGFVNHVLAELRARKEAVEVDCRERKRSGDRVGYLAARGALLALRARIAWLDEVAAAIDDA